jgi:hypothetical protein
MKHTIPAILALLTALVPAQAQAAGITGQYVEARTCDVWTGPCFANADFNLGGKHAVLAWKIDAGTVDNVKLDGLSVVAVVSARNTLGLEQSGPAKSVLIVDARANSVQKDALVRFAKRQAGKLLDNVAGVQSAPVNVTMCQCEGQTCAEVNATVAKVKTRCIDHKEDKACGNESAFYPPLSSGVDARVAGVVEHLFRGNGLGETWSDYGRRGAYVGSFDVR